MHESPDDHNLILPPTEDCWFLTGPTASGKTRVGLELAEQLGAEIISMDSMAIYRGMDIGTAKPLPEERRRRPHHLVDVLEPNVDFSVSAFASAAHERIREIRARQREVLFVGGTPLYLKAFLRGLYQGPPADWEFRRQIDEEVGRLGVEVLRERLEQVDPLSAARLHPHDVRRMIRALEVYKLTGQPISHQQTQFEEGRPAEECRVFVLGWPRAMLHERIDERVERMFAEGLVDEVRGLLDRYGELSRTAAQAVGYREVIAHLRGEQDLETTVRSVKSRTRQFVRRQETWFRSLRECCRMEQRPGIDAAEAAREILQCSRAS